MHKPFKTIDEQVGILTTRGVQTDAEAAGILMREGYYSVINGYKDMFLDNEASILAGDDRYIIGTKFSDIYRLFTFDRELRVTLMGYFAMAESALKTACSYSFTQRHADEPNAYLNVSHYSEQTQEDGRAEALICEFNKILHATKDTRRRPFKRDYIKHYVEHHDGEVPLWVLMNFAMLGQAFKFFDFQDAAAQNAIARNFSTMYSQTHMTPRKIHARELLRAYDHIKDFRNICAHDERLYCSRVAKAKDISLARLLQDLEIVLPGQQHRKMILEVLNLTIGVMHDLGDTSGEVLRRMGFDSIEGAFAKTD